MPVHSETSLTYNLRAEAVWFARVAPCPFPPFHICHLRFSVYFIDYFHRSSFLFSNGVPSLSSSLSLFFSELLVTLLSLARYLTRNNLGQEGLILVHKRLWSVMAEKAGQWRRYGQQECEAAVAHFSVGQWPGESVLSKRTSRPDPESTASSR